MSNALGMDTTADAKGGSDRSFGIMFAVIFLLVIGWLRWRGEGEGAAPVLLGLAAVTLGVALVRPRLLRPFNRGWMAFSVLLGRIVSPIVLSVLYFVLITPLAAALRLGGRDELRLRRTPRDSHWRPRGARGYTLEQFGNQY
jgi:hypothetical protein